MSFKELLDFDKELIELNGEILCGIDEAGRGPLAGPVFAACAMLKGETEIPQLNDSKKLSEKKREVIFEQIMTEDIAWFGIGAATEKEIDEINILQATFLAMRRAHAAMMKSMEGEQLPQLVLVDGNRDPSIDMHTITVVKGDGKSASIAVASILAKVSRDRYMLKLDEKYPEYQFCKHKGYGTKVHYECIAEHGISPVHRLSFLKKITGEV